MLTKTKIYLSSPHMGCSEQKFINEAFDTNWVFPLGSNIEGFEKGRCFPSGSNLTQNDLIELSILSRKSQIYDKKIP